jgi:phospholipid transport system substrate-binding protein
MTPISRRHFLTTLCAAALVGLTPLRALALNADSAAQLVGRVVNDINGVINSGKSESQMIQEFARIFVRYSDIATIARSSLGPDARRATAAQMKSYTQAFTGYMARKYGKRFREFIGARIDVKSTRPIKDNFEVKTMADLKGQAPFEVIFLVSNKSGKDLFYDMLIEGVSLLRSERTEIGAMIDRRGGNLDAMIQDLARAG